MTHRTIRFGTGDGCTFGYWKTIEECRAHKCRQKGSFFADYWSARWDRVQEIFDEFGPYVYYWPEARYVSDSEHGSEALTRECVMVGKDLLWFDGCEWKTEPHPKRHYANPIEGYSVTA